MSLPPPPPLFYLQKNNKETALSPSAPFRRRTKYDSRIPTRLLDNNETLYGAVNGEETRSGTRTAWKWLILRFLNFLFFFLSTHSVKAVRVVFDVYCTLTAMHTYMHTYTHCFAIYLQH